MKRLLLVFAFAFTLSGCEAIAQFTSSVDNGIGNTAQPSLQELQVKDFCALKSSDFEAAKRTYTGKTYIFTGKIDSFVNGSYTVGIKGNGGIVWARFEVFDTTYRVGDSIRVRGVISPENFNQKNRSKCMILLDDVYFHDL